MCFLRPIRIHNPNGKSIASAIFAQLTAKCRRACPGMSFPQIIAPSHGSHGWVAWIWVPSNTCFLGHTRVHNPNDISIGSAVFAQLTAECRRAHWRHLVNTIELVLPSAHSSPQPKRQIDRFSRFCTAHSRKSVYFTIGALFPKNCPYPWGFWTPI